jgi:GT2 family glycosyltransferase
MSPYHTKDIAIALLNWNGKNLLEQFLPDVIKFSDDAAIYVIDNYSTDGSVNYLHENVSGVNIIQLEKNLGYAGGYNEGLKQIKAPIVCCLNTDVAVTPGWLNPVIESFNSSKDIAIVQPKILDYKKPDYFEYAGAGGGFIDKYGYPYCRGRIFDEIEKDLGQYDDKRSIFWASGACFFVKTDFFKELGGFDPDFFAHMEEIDLCWRCYNKGYTIQYNGQSAVYHVGGSTLSHSNPRKTFLNFRNSLFTLVKNSPVPLPLIFSRLILDGFAALRFLFKLQIGHFISVLKAHFSFYRHLRKMLHKREHLPVKKKDYYQTRSIVWQFFIKKKRIFTT